VTNISRLKFQRDLTSKRSFAKRGFTLIEMMIVLAIIMILIGIADGESISGQWSARKRRRCRSDLSVMRQAIDHYTLDKEAAPQALEDLVNPPIAVPAQRYPPTQSRMPRTGTWILGTLYRNGMHIHDRGWHRLIGPSRVPKIHVPVLGIVIGSVGISRRLLRLRVYQVFQGLRRGLLIQRVVINRLPHHRQNHCAASLFRADH